MYCGINRWGYFQERKAPLQQLHSEKGGGLIFEGGPTFEITVHSVYLSSTITYSSCYLFVLYHPERHLLLALVATLSDRLHPCINIFKKKTKKKHSNIAFNLWVHDFQCMTTRSPSNFPLKCSLSSLYTALLSLRN